MIFFFPVLLLQEISGQLEAYILSPKPNNMSFIKKLLINWKTTIAGIIVAINVIVDELFLLVDSDALTNPNWEVVIAQVSIAIGLMAWRCCTNSLLTTAVSVTPINF